MEGKRMTLNTINSEEFSKIKCIIWDLDETFWRGTLSEGDVDIPEAHRQLIIDMVDAGVISSICSKNDFDMVDKKLQSYGLSDLFVFQSVDWTSKGYRVKHIVEEMHLRFSNVLFVDDNPSNRGEVCHVCEGIMVADVDIIPELCSYFRNVKKTDTDRKRLKQYAVLEEKNRQQKSSGNLEEFLLKSNIQVEIGKNCLKYIDRITELIARSNQLNFTKKRDSKEQLCALLRDDNVECAYVRVKDNFGDYGVVGFYAVKDGKLIHFTFSCRTLGMGIEQYVWCMLGKPKIKIIGEVASNLEEPKVTWINVKNNDKKIIEEQASIGNKMVIHGPCDLSSIFAFIKETPNIIKEFNFVNDKGVSIEQRNCTTHIREYHAFDEKVQTSSRIKKLPFYDKEMYKTAIFDKDNAFVMISLFTDPCLAMYKEKRTGLIVCFGDYCYDLTDENRWDEYLGQKPYLHNCTFIEEDLRYIGDNFEYLGRIQPKQIVDNINYIYRHLCEGCQLILTLQSETPFETTNQDYMYDGIWPRLADRVERHIYNKRLNDDIKRWAIGKDNVHFLDFNKYIIGQESFRDHISHFNREVYYKMSSELVEIVRNNSCIHIKNQNKIEILLISMLRKLRRGIHLIKKRII